MDATTARLTFPGYQDPVTPFQPAPLYECGCASKSIDRTPSAVTQKPITGRNVCLYDRETQKALVNGYNLPLAELIVPSTHTPKLPEDPDVILEKIVDERMVETEASIKDKPLSSYFYANRNRIRKLYTSLLDYKQYLKAFTVIGQQLFNECPEFSLSEKGERVVRKIPFERLRSSIGRQAVKGGNEGFDELLYECAEQTDYEYLTSNRSGSSESSGASSVLRKIVSAQLNRAAHGDNLLGTQSDSCVKAKLRHFLLWGTGGYARNVEFVGFMPYLTGDYLASRLPYYEDPTNLDFLLTHGVHSHVLSEYVAAHAGILDADLLSFLIVGDEWDSTLDRYSIEDPFCHKLSDDLLLANWPVPVSPTYLNRFLLLGQFSEVINDVLSEGCEERIRKLAEILGCKGDHEAQVACLKNSKDALRCLEITIFEQQQKHLSRQAKQYGIDVDQAHQVTATEPDRTYSSLSGGCYDQKSVRLDRVEKALAKGYQVIGVKIDNDNVRGPCNLFSIKPDAPPETLADFKAFAIVRGSAIEFPDYIY
ncbi:hypothetical protein [Endozoicomonas numazuensis]|uniref:Uncharacterized protein n=1 Tax=Endozoicomonas numazuensis TaxID=1137799 RepID=A0A081NFZ1_9GAMM|nr:hypothetical protein [Endozoicomonas numazuensis]KEQ17364.1 hypothetical protein GZ78_16330 [Endozoicomonas numazuensis]